MEEFASLGTASILRRCRCAYCLIFTSGSIPDNEAGAAAWKAEFKSPSAEEEFFKNPSDPVDDPVADWNLYSWLHHSLLTGSG